MGEKTEVTDAHEAGRQQVEQKPAQELLYGECHEALLVAVRGVSPTECDLVIGQGNEAVVGDGHSMGIAAEVMENVLRATEGPFAIDAPILAEQLPEEAGESFRLSQRQEVAVETELAIRELVLQSFDKLASKDAAEHSDGKKEAIAWMDPAVVIEG